MYDKKGGGLEGLVRCGGFVLVVPRELDKVRNVVRGAERKRADERTPGVFSRTSRRTRGVTERSWLQGDKISDLVKGRAGLTRKTAVPAPTPQVAPLRAHGRAN